MQLGTLIPGVCRGRPNRFLLRVLTASGEILAHLANSGRLTEVLGEGTRVYVRPVPPSPQRRTAADVVLMEAPGGSWVGVDTRLPPRLLVEAVESGLVPPFTAATRIRQEVTWGDSRFDLSLDPWLVETKSVTLVRQGIGLFPDAPTLRGQRHLRTLSHRAHQGLPTMVVFVVQRQDAHAVRPHGHIDQRFAAELCQAQEAGVVLRAFVTRVQPGEICISQEIPVEL